MVKLPTRQIDFGYAPKGVVVQPLTSAELLLRDERGEIEPFLRGLMICADTRYHLEQWERRKRGQAT